LIAVVGGGVFGVTAALELRRRGRRVALLDPGPLPHPLAESTDVSKIVRLDYGADEEYVALMERALDGWRRWNERWPEPLFHEIGVAFLRRDAMAPGGFEHESFALLARRGHRLERLDGAAIARRFPAFRAGAFADGYFNPQGGFAESGRVVARLVEEAAAAGVDVQPGRACAHLFERGDKVRGLVDREGRTLEADAVVVAAGSWTGHLLPDLAGALRSVGQPVFHLRPADPAPFAAARFPVFAADIARTGWYGFPSTRDGLVKIANHGVGRPMHPESPERAVTPDEERALRRFLDGSLPALAAAPLAATRTCVYGDSLDEHFLIAPHPERPGLVVAAGGSGHGFKFAPVLGALIADAVEGAVVPRFRFRLPGDPPPTGEEAARHRG